MNILTIRAYMLTFLCVACGVAAPLQAQPKLPLPCTLFDDVRVPFIDFGAETSAVYPAGSTVLVSDIKQGKMLIAGTIRYTKKRYSQQPEIVEQQHEAWVPLKSGDLLAAFPFLMRRYAPGSDERKAFEEVVRVVAARVAFEWLQKHASPAKVQGKVLQVVSDGVLVEDDCMGLCFVRDIGATELVDGDPFQALCFELGTYRYTNVMGASRTVRRYGARMPDVVKTEYDRIINTVTQRTMDAGQYDEGTK